MCPIQYGNAPTHSKPEIQRKKMSCLVCVNWPHCDTSRHHHPIYRCTALAHNSWKRRQDSVLLVACSQNVIHAVLVLNCLWEPLKSSCTCHDLRALKQICRKAFSYVLCSRGISHPRGFRFLLYTMCTESGLSRAHHLWLTVTPV